MDDHEGLGLPEMDSPTEHDVAAEDAQAVNKSGANTPEDYLLSGPDAVSQPPAPPRPAVAQPPVPVKPAAPKRRMVFFPALSYKSFSYPKDEEALQTMKNIPGVPKLFDWIIDNLLEEYLALDHLYNSVRVTPQQYPTVYNTVGRCCKILDCPMPEVYVSFDTGFNAMTSGVDRTFVTIGSRVVDLFSPDDMMFIVGHELGHIKANHVLYKTVGRFIVEFLPVLQSMIPFNIGLLTKPLLLALSEWDRRSEFTCDRAGLLCNQSPESAYSALSWFAGRLRSLPQEYDPRLLDVQVQSIQQSKNQMARLLLFLSSINQSHPYSVLRVSELRAWQVSGAYQKILGGDYIRDVMGEHEAGLRRKCTRCGTKVNSKLDFCPKCGNALRGAPAGPAAGQGVLCAKCGKPTSPEARFCPHCGAPAAQSMPPLPPPGKACPQCGVQAAPDATFCTACGGKLEG